MEQRIYSEFSKEPIGIITEKSKIIEFEKYLENIMNQIENVKEYSEKEFDDSMIDLQQKLFHVSRKDKDKNGAALDETILIQHLFYNQWMLKFKDLKWFYDIVIDAEE